MKCPAIVSALTSVSEHLRIHGVKCTAREIIPFKDDAVCFGGNAESKDQANLKECAIDQGPRSNSPLALTDRGTTWRLITASKRA